CSRSSSLGNCARLRAGIQESPLFCHSLFESGINWGRVIALLAFGYRLAMHVWQRGVSGFLRLIARCLGEFMLQHRIARWIAQQGGWVRGTGQGGQGDSLGQRVTDPSVPSPQVAALDLDNVYVKYVLVMAVVVLGHLAVRRFFTP
uniref:Bcl-2 Bcl-2 homology region 1-3 domain-containing protein n=1 Tax=Malurus cyaneus samueli TaxID=2593467 RepID=A0A8C5UAW6_9PASS